MPRSASSIQAEISAIEAQLASADSMVASTSSNGVSLTFAQRSALEKRLDSLYIQLDRATGAAPMFVRSRIRGVDGG